MGTTRVSCDCNSSLARCCRCYNTPPRLTVLFPWPFRLPASTAQTSAYARHERRINVARSMSVQAMVSTKDTVSLKRSASQAGLSTSKPDPCVTAKDVESGVLPDQQVASHVTPHDACVSQTRRCMP